MTTLQQNKELEPGYKATASLNMLFSSTGVSFQQDLLSKEQLIYTVALDAQSFQPGCFAEYFTPSVFSFHPH
jgi:hypothetical protein